MKKFSAYFPPRKLGKRGSERGRKAGKEGHRVELDKKLESWRRNRFTVKMLRENRGRKFQANCAAGGGPNDFSRPALEIPLSSSWNVNPLETGTRNLINQQLFFSREVVA